MPDLFDAAMRRLERRLAEVMAERDALAAELDKRRALISITGNRLCLFPSAQRKFQIRAAVAKLRRTSTDQRDANIRECVDRHVAALGRQGFAADVIEKDAAAFERAIRSELDGATSENGGTAA